MPRQIKPPSALEPSEAISPIGVSNAKQSPRSADKVQSTKRDEASKKNLLSRCNRVEGQIRGVRGMLEKDLYCDDILHQIQAARAALDSIARLVLELHMKECLVSRVRAGDDEVVDELLVTLQKMMR